AGAAAGDETPPRLEGAVAVAQQHAQPARFPSGTDKVEPAVGVDVAQQDGRLIGADGDVLARPEGAVAVAQKHVQGVLGVAADEVELAVAIDIPDGQGDGRDADGKGGKHVEGATLPAHQDADGAAVLVGREDVGPPVAVEVGDQDGAGPVIDL